MQRTRDVMSGAMCEALCVRQCSRGVYSLVVMENRGTHCGKCSVGKGEDHLDWWIKEVLDEGGTWARKFGRIFARGNAEEGCSRQREWR